MNRSVKFLAAGGLLVAMDILCARFLFFYTPGNVARISMQFLPNSFSGLLFGPVWGAFVCIIGDIVGMLMNPAGLVFTPLITLACALRGIIYGLILHKHPVKLTRCIVAVAAVVLLVDIGYMPLALAVNYGSSWLPMFLGRLILLAAIPVYSSILYAVARAAERAGILLGHKFIKKGNN